MARVTVAVTTVGLLLIANVTLAEQTGQQSAQQWQDNASNTASSIRSGTMTLQQQSASAAQRVATLSEQQNVDLRKVISTAEQKAKGKAVAVVLIAPQDGNSAVSSKNEQIHANVVIATDNQLQLVAVDAKDNKVVSTQDRPVVRNLWSGASDSDVQDMSSPNSRDAASSDRSSMERSAREGVRAMGGQNGLTQEQARKIYQVVDKENVDLNKVIKAAEQETKGKAVAAFLALNQDNYSAVGSDRETARSSDSSSEQNQLTAHVYVVVDNKVKLAVVDPKTNKVRNVESRSTLDSPWEGSINVRSRGATDNGAVRSRDISVQQSDQPVDVNPSTPSSPSFPTGSGSGSGHGTLGGK